MTREIGEHFVRVTDAKEWAQAAVVGVPKDSVVVGFSAAAIWGMPLPPSVAQVLKSVPVSLSRREAAAAIRRPRVDGHSIDLPADRCAMNESLVLTTPARTWVDCPALLPAEHLLAMGDWALARGLLTLDEIKAIVTWARGRRGVVRAREVLPWIRTGVESAQESRLRWHIVADHLPEPEINPEIVLPGRRLVRLDLAYRGLRIALEFDGEWHFHTQEHDAQRRRELMDAGWKLIVATKEDFLHPSGVLTMIRAGIAERSSIGKRRW